MPLYSADALILRTYKLGEADRIVVFLTRDRGKKRGVAKGARRPKSNFVGALEPLTHVRVAYFEKERRELVSLNYSEPSRSALSSGTIEALGCASYFAELIDEWAAESHEDERLYRLGVSMVDALAGRRTARAPDAVLRVLAAQPAGRLPGGARAESLARGAGVPGRGAQDRPAGPGRDGRRSRDVARAGVAASQPHRHASRARASIDQSPKGNDAVVTLQDLILKLSAFWASQGCIIQQPLDLEVGAGTSHPETLLRVLGPKPWNVAYVQPSRRPDDGRFGQNPNRVFKHHQFQVILKPAPDEVQQIYLQSLEAVGIDPRAHDIRFEEDNWESPTLGAWGIGWQVLFDGLEITQFTYFQQVGGVNLAPVSAELTYGLERIAMILQKVDNIFDLEWGGGVKYGEVRLREEIEQSKYVYGQVDGMSREEFAAFHRDLFDKYYGMAERLLKSGLILPALEYALEVLAPLQHSRFERQRRRDRTDRLCACGSVRLRLRLRRHMWRTTGAPIGVRRTSVTERGSDPSKMERELLLEIGTEELPASWLPGLTRQIRDGLDGASAGASADRRRAGRKLQHAATADGAHREDRGTAERSRGASHRPSSRRGVWRRTASPRRRRSALHARTTSTSASSSASRRRRARISAIAGTSAAKPLSMCCPTCSRPRCARSASRKPCTGMRISKTAKGSCCSGGPSDGFSICMAAASCRSRSAAPSSPNRQRCRKWCRPRSPTATGS